MDVQEQDASTQDSSEFPELAIPDDDESISLGCPDQIEIPSTAAIPHSKIAWSIPVEIIFDKNEKSGIDEALSKGKFSIIFDKEAAGSALKSNKRKHKGTSTLHICQVCNKEFKEKRPFIRHQLSHSTEKAHSCKECKKSFKHLWTLTKHVKMKHSCELSASEPSSQSSPELDSPEEDEPKENVKSNCGGQIHNCSKCDKKFPYASHLALHLKTHDGIKDLSCPEPDCGKKFKSSSHLNDHIRGHSKGFICHICQGGYRSRSALQYHITKAHTEPPPPSDQLKQCYCCDLCGKVFADKRALHAHSLAHKVRPGIHPEQTLKKVRGAAKLQINEGDTPGDLTNFVIPFEKVGKTTWYHCTTCGRRFYSAPSIMSHIYATHNKDLTTVTMCEKEFTDY